MNRFKLLSAATLAFGLLIALPLVAADPELPQEPPVQVEVRDDDTGPWVPSLEALLTEEPLQSPAADPAEDLESLIDPSRDLFREKIEICVDDPVCPPGCVCVIIRNQVNCFC